MDYDANCRNWSVFFTYFYLQFVKYCPIVINPFQWGGVSCRNFLQARCNRHCTILKWINYSATKKRLLCCIWSTSAGIESYIMFIPISVVCTCSVVLHKVYYQLNHQNPIVNEILYFSFLMLKYFVCSSMIYIINIFMLKSKMYSEYNIQNHWKMRCKMQFFILSQIIYR